MDNTSSNNETEIKSSKGKKNNCPRTVLRIRKEKLFLLRNLQNGKDKINYKSRYNLEWGYSFNHPIEFYWVSKNKLHSIRQRLEAFPSVAKSLTCMARPFNNHFPISIRIVLCTTKIFSGYSQFTTVSFKPFKFPEIVS